MACSEGSSGEMLLAVLKSVKPSSALTDLKSANPSPANHRKQYQVMYKHFSWQRETENWNLTIMCRLHEPRVCHFTILQEKKAGGLVVALLESSEKLWGCRESREEHTSLHINATSSKDTLTCKELKLEQKMIKQFHKKSILTSYLISL